MEKNHQIDHRPPPSWAWVVKDCLHTQSRTIQWLGDAVGFSGATVTRWLDGSRGCTEANRVRIAFFLGISPRMLDCPEPQVQTAVEDKVLVAAAGTP